MQLVVKDLLAEVTLHNIMSRNVAEHPPPPGPAGGSDLSNRAAMLTKVNRVESEH